MNKLYTISILLIWFSISSQAQQLEVGVKGGLSLVDVVAVSVPNGIGSGDSHYEIRSSY